MKKMLLLLAVCLVAVQAQAAPTAAQQKPILAKAKALTGKTCATFTTYEESEPLSPLSFEMSLETMVGFQEGTGTKLLKQKRTKTEIQQYVDNKTLSRREFIYYGIIGKKTVTATCILKK